MLDSKDDYSYMGNENYAEGYNENMRQNYDEEGYKIEEVCHKLFRQNEDGAELMKQITERYLIPALALPSNPNYKTLCPYFEGFKEAFRMLIRSADLHEMRIKQKQEEANNAK